MMYHFLFHCIIQAELNFNCRLLQIAPLMQCLKKPVHFLVLPLKLWRSKHIPLHVILQIFNGTLYLLILIIFNCVFISFWDQPHSTLFYSRIFFRFHFLTQVFCWLYKKMFKRFSALFTSQNLVKWPNIRFMLRFIDWVEKLSASLSHKEHLISSPLSQIRKLDTP